MIVYEYRSTWKVMNEQKWITSISYNSSSINFQCLGHVGTVEWNPSLQSLTNALQWSTDYYQLHSKWFSITCRGRAKKYVHVMAHGFMNDSTQHFVLYVTNLTHLGTCTSHSFVHILKQTITEGQSMFVLECWV